MGADVRHPLAGVVVAVNGSTGPASGIVYDCRINMPGSPNLLFSGVVPFRPRWPDIIDTVPAPVGTPIDVLMFGTDMFFDIPELPKITECP